MSNISNVSVGKPPTGGAVYRAPIGTELPESATTALEAAFKSLGYISSDGLTNNNSPESDTKKAWGGDTVITLQTDKPDTFTFKLIEALNVEVLKAVYGDVNVSGNMDGGIRLIANSDEQRECSLIIEMIMRGGVLKRIVIPYAKVTEVGEIVYGDEDTIGYETTFTAMPDALGNTHYEYIVKGE